MQANEEGGEEVLQRDSPAALGEDCGDASCQPEAHGGLWWSRYSQCSRGPHTRARGSAPKEAAVCGKPMLEQG